MRRHLIAAALLAATGCAGTTTSDPGPDASKVDWKNYTPDLPAQLRRSTCVELQRQFDNAEANNAAQRNRTGDGNADLMGYIDELEVDRGCHD